MDKNKVTRESFENGMINLAQNQKNLDSDFVEALDELFSTQKRKRNEK